MAKRIAHTLSILDIVKLFATEADAAKWFELVRWNGKPACPQCGTTEQLSKPAHKPFAYWCKACRQRFTVRMGTVMESSKIPLQKWAIAMYYTLTARKGISSLQLSKELKVTQKTAWFLLQRIREACQRDQFKLMGIVEVDEVYLGGKPRPVPVVQAKNRNTRADKQAVLGIRERQGATMTVPIARTDKATIYPIIQRNVERGTLVCTDDARAYRSLDQLGYEHRSVRHSAGEYVKHGIHTNSIESVWAVLRRSLHGIYHWVSTKHLSKYLNEATFRLHEGNCQVDTIDRMVALTCGMVGRRLTYKQLTNG
ncbi:MAG: IS1595 family transposase [Nitrospira sp. SB0672_bin_25]|nr:IS1595 family transposase [Nitrospira sp. SB0666_bin_27]MYF24254.1 IS1595 family transposase [Nitrospira sp. SB0678_bin_10]MYJ54252.1 IS1595 family transposase [Nitrospira sp. SB0672_bin_25]